MKAIHRFIVAILEIAAFLAISYGITGSFAFIQDASSPFNLLFVSSAVFIILGQYISEPFFTTPLGAISNSVAAILILLAINSPSSFLFYEPILALFIAILVSAVVVLALNALDILPRIKKTLLVITTNLGKSKVLYSVIYLFGAVSYLKDDPTILLIMLIAWVIVVCTNWLEAVIARNDGGSAVNLGDGVTHEFVILQEGVEELHLRAKLRCGKVLRSDPQRLRDVFQDFLLWLAVAQLVAAQGALADAAELCQLLLGELPLLPELLDLAGV